MVDSLNRKVILASRPVGVPQADHFAVKEDPRPAAAEGQFVLRNRFLSVSPAMRGWVNAVKNYSDPVPVGAVMRANTVGEVVESRHPGDAAGEILVGMFGWQTFAVDDGSAVTTRLENPTAPLSAYLGVLGISGVTAYFGLLDVGRPKAGDTVVVSTAAGSVGSVAGQIAKIKGCRTVGLTGSDAKVRQCIEDFGYDAAINYRTADLDAALAEACPDGVDVYYDNVSGAVSDAVYRHLAMGARCVICGTVSVASWDPPPQGPRIERYMLVNRARFQGFVIYDYRPRWPEAVRDLSGWLKAGELTYREEILEGIDAAPGSIARLYDGDNMGKLSIRV
ncbi:MAG: NADP-dependent oxidoreductase [Bauldia litoralis]